MLTADTITDEQIESLVWPIVENGEGFIVDDEYVPTSVVISLRDEALDEDGLCSEHVACAIRRRKARSFFAGILNERAKAVRP